MTTTRVPDIRALYRYFINTGWLFAGFAPQITSKSVFMTSESEHVVAATPIVALSAVVEGA